MKSVGMCVPVGRSESREANSAMAVAASYELRPDGDWKHEICNLKF